jgi:hypothetical protein
MKHYLSLTLILLFFYNPAFSQIPGLTQFTTNNGLPSNTVYDIINDETGFLWIATDYGLSKFDGVSFTNYTIENGLPGNEILYFFKDSQQRIWLVPFNGNIGFIQNGNFHNKKTDPFLNKLNFDGFIRNIYEDPKGNIWFCRNYKSVKRLDNNLNVESFSFKKEKNSKLSSCIIEDKNNNLFLFSYYTIKKNIYLVTKLLNKNYKTNTWNSFNYKNFDSKTINNLKINAGFLLKNVNDTINLISSKCFKQKTNYISKIYSINNSYWITNLNQGVQIFNKNTIDNPPKIILPSVRTTRAFIDNENNIWIGSTSNGLYFFPNLNINGIQFADKKKNDLHTVSFYNNKIIIGNEKSELLILNPETLASEFTLTTSNTSERIRHLKKYKGKLYVLSDLNLKILNTQFKLENITKIADANFSKAQLTYFKDITFNNKFIFTANANGVAKISCNNFEVSKLWDKRSTSILYKKDSLWIGTTKGLFLTTKNKTKPFDIGSHFKNSIIYSIENSPFGLLIGSNSYGLGILNNGKFKSISTKNGLLSNYIKNIFLDPQNNIWLSTNFGLNKLVLNKDLSIKSIKSYTISDGLYSNDVRDCYVKNNKVYVVTSNGLNVIDLSKETISKLTPKIHINEISVNNRIINPSNENSFNYKNNNFQFNFSGISFKSLGTIYFKYHLKGLENDWIKTTNHTIRYSALPSGNYTFKIKAISKSNKESAKIASYSFTIHPIFYTTWWFELIVVLTVLGITSFIIYNRSQRLKRQHELNEKITNLKYQALNAQMNPHFMNNLLVNINDLTAKGSFNLVQQSLQNFGQLVNLTLHATKSNLISLANEIEMTRLYLELQKIRFNKNLNFDIDISKIEIDVDYIMVPPMIIQPIVENSLKHGFKNGTKENKINLNFTIENNEFLICEIIDNGTGIQQDNNKTKGTGISIKNIQERLQYLNEKSSKEKFIIISNIKDEFNTLVGAKVILKIPLINI